MRSRLSVNKAVRRPMRAEAIAASQPACPAPTTTTSYCSVKAIRSTSIVSSLSKENAAAEAAASSYRLFWLELQANTKLQLARAIREVAVIGRRRLTEGRG